MAGWECLRQLLSQPELYPGCGCLASAAMTHRDTMSKAARLQKGRGRNLLEDHSGRLGRDRVHSVASETTPARMRGCTDGFPASMLSFLQCGV